MAKFAVLVLSLSLMLSMTLMPTEKSSSGAPRMIPVSGIVTLDGVPLSEGEIVLQDPQTLESFCGMIEEGRFQVNAPEGMLKVLIVSWRDEVPAGQSESRPAGISLPRKQILPPVFNVKTNLGITVQANRKWFAIPLLSSGSYDRIYSETNLRTIL